MISYLLCDDPDIRQQLLPFTFTRPVARLRVGIDTLEEKWRDFLGPSSGFITAGYLQTLFAARYSDNNLLINASFIPDEELAQAVSALEPGYVLTCAGGWIACRCSRTEAEAFEPKVCLSGRKERPYSGNCLQIRHPWDIFMQNGKQIERDLARISKGRKTAALKGNGIRQWGAYPVFAEENARVEQAMIDTTEGPVYLGRDTVIMPGSIVKGPLALCEGSIIKMGARIYGGNTFGPYCKVAGEVECTVMTGYSNKAHDGFLGDAVLGEWCNLGAGTNCSNLKNDYSQVKVWSYAQDRFVPTGLQFCGLLMGDHSKSAIGTQFNTGTVVGVGANVFGAGFPKNFIPSFTWGKETYRVERAIETAKIVYARRNRTFGEEEAEVLRAVYRLSAGNRERSQSE
ncbi:MAG: glucose-1-phosphate thymidylyltransferase [Bacteroidales bacterium]|nr:glucose-1-phosphate thymidylyltransferase [Bacteroidales bacterium]